MHEIIIQISGFYSKSKTYKFKLNILGSQQTNKTSDNVKKGPKSPTLGNISAKIYSISPHGTIVVKFSESLKPIEVSNLSHVLNSTNIQVVLKPFNGKKGQENKKISKWEVLNITQSEMKIQVNFTDPSLISPRIVSKTNDLNGLDRMKKIKLRLCLKMAD